MTDADRKQIAILRILDQAQESLGAGKIAVELRDYGIDLEERAVRYHLDALDQLGFTEPRGRRGRQITSAGRRELESARVADKVNLVLARLEAFAYLTTLDTATGHGDVPLNISFVPRASRDAALHVMRPILNSGFATSRRLLILEAGEHAGNQEVPADWVGIGTVCSVAINGVLLKAGVPIHSLFGGLLSVEGRRPRRFTELVHYGYTSMDPLEVFIKSGRTSVTHAVTNGVGVVGASFREFPGVAHGHVLEVLEAVGPWGITSALAVGSASCPVFEADVPPGRCGLVIAAGLNPIAAVEESGIPTRSHAMTAMFSFEALTDVNDLLR